MGARIETEMMSKIILTLCMMAAVATATGPCKKDGDCQTDGDMSAYCKDNNDCHCSAPHFNNADDTCKLACSPGDASNACCRDDADCQANGDTGGYCKTLRGYNPGNGECRCDAGFSGTTSCKKSAVAVEVSRMAPASSLKLCSPCIQLCSGLKKKGSQTVCNLICDVVGMKTFVKVLNSTDLDPIYFCEELGACPKGNPSAQGEINAVVVSPASGPSGTKFQMEVEFSVSNATSVSEIRIAVDGPTTAQVNQGFLQMGFAPGSFSANVSLDTKDVDPDPSDPSDPGVQWNPGTYNYTFEFCQGECGSRHPGDIAFGKKTGTFEITN